MGFSIAIDGPAGAGKSSIAKIVAKELNFIYVDTGAMYRAMALCFIRNQIGKDEEERIKSACERMEIAIRFRDGEQQILLDGENANHLIRTEEVGNMASSTSKYPAVRSKLLQMQRDLAKKEDVVMDGRDIGTYVLPDADIKFYLTADAGTRAKRRWVELQERGIGCDLDQIKADIVKRDHQDMNREVAPLKKAEDAILIDSSKMSIKEVTKKIIQTYQDFHDAAPEECDDC